MSQLSLQPFLLREIKLRSISSIILDKLVEYQKLVWLGGGKTETLLSIQLKNIKSSNSFLNLCVRGYLNGEIPQTLGFTLLLPFIHCFPQRLFLTIVPRVHATTFSEQPKSTCPLKPSFYFPLSINFPSIE